jgi:hypothetical protein
MSKAPASPALSAEWTPHFWLGCDFFAWLRLLGRNRLAVHLSLAYVALIVTVVSMVHTVLRCVQDALFGSRVDRTPIPHAPLFIIGHWRTGTTLLHELLILDARHGYPSTYHCLAPNHFLLTERLFKRLFWFLMPSHRPMDNMAMGWDRPQEDEFALALLGQPSPYLTIAFPNHPPQDQDALDLDGLSPRARAGWQAALLKFVRQLTLRDPRRLILKSPTHSCRIRWLLELFPDARFVHIVRDPHVVFPSTVNLWKSLYLSQGFQKPTYAGLEEHVFSTFLRLYEKLDEGRKRVAPNRFHEMKYEDLIRDPEGEMRRLYERLELGGFEEFLPRMRRYLADNAGYQTNRYRPLPPELHKEITRRWGEVLHRYGYDQIVPQEKGETA